MSEHRTVNDHIEKKKSELAYQHCTDIRNTERKRLAAQECILQRQQELQRRLRVQHSLHIAGRSYLMKLVLTAGTAGILHIHLHFRHCRIHYYYLQKKIDNVRRELSTESVATIISFVFLPLITLAAIAISLALSVH